MEEIKLTRKELYDLVWSEPITKLSKRYFISDFELRMICQEMNIPLPKNGHWQKILWRKEVSKEILDPTFLGKQEVVITPGVKNQGESSSRSSVKKLEKVLEKDSSLIVPAKLASPHKLIIEARDNLTGKDMYTHQGLVNTHRGFLDIKVNTKNISRALRFMDTLIKALIQREHHVILENDQTKAVVFDEKIRISFREKLKRTMVPGKYYDSAEYTPTGVLCFRMDGYYGREWTDGKLLIEAQLPNILSRLEHEANRIKEQREESRKYHERYERERQAKLEAEELRKKELSDFKKLLLASERWQKTILLRSYINDIGQQAILKNAVSDDLNKWLDWARKKIDWYDPQINLEDEILKNVDKDSLIFSNVNY